MNRLHHERRVRINNELADYALAQSRKVEAGLKEIQYKMIGMYHAKNKPWMVESSTAKLRALPARFAKERQNIEHKRRTLAYYSGIDPTEQELEAEEGRELREILEGIKKAESRGRQSSMKSGREDLIETMTHYDEMRSVYGHSTSSSH